MLDHRVRLLETDLRMLIGGAQSQQVGSSPMSISSGGECKSNLVQDSTMARMEELRQKIASRRGSAGLKQAVGKQSESRQSAVGGKTSSGSSSSDNFMLGQLDSHSRSSSASSNGSSIGATSNPLHSRSNSGRFRAVSAHMPEQLENFGSHMEALPSTSRRRFPLLPSANRDQNDPLRFQHLNSLSSTGAKVSERDHTLLMNMGRQIPASSSMTTTVVEVNRDHLEAV